MTAVPTTIAAITLFAEDLVAAKAFYLDVFDATVVFEDESSCVFRFGDTLVNVLDAASAPELIEPARVAPVDGGSRAVYTIDVHDVADMCQQLTSRGVDLLNGPMDRPWGIRTASFRDPGGHIWEIAQPLNSTP